MWANGPGSGIKAGNPQPLGEGEAALCSTYSLLWKCEPGTRARAGFFPLWVILGLWQSASQDQQAHPLVSIACSPPARNH